MEILEQKQKLTFLGKYIIPRAIKYRNNLALKFIHEHNELLIDNKI